MSQLLPKHLRRRFELTGRVTWVEAVAQARGDVKLLLALIYAGRIRTYAIDGSLIERPLPVEEWASPNLDYASGWMTFRTWQGAKCVMTDALILLDRADLDSCFPAAPGAQAIEPATGALETEPGAKRWPEIDDDALINRMHTALKTPGRKRWEVGLELAVEAGGVGLLKARAKRLLRKYNKKFS